MAIRLRTIDGIRIAVCAVETDAEPGDVYLDDVDHCALAAKFAQDWETGVIYNEEWQVMETQKLRDAKIELLSWLESRKPQDIKFRMREGERDE